MGVATEPRLEPEIDFQVLAWKTFRFDWFTSLMLAMVLLAGAIVLWLSAVWVSNQVWAPKVPAVGVEVIEIALDDLEGMAGDDPQLGENQAVTPADLPAREQNLAFDEPQIPEVMSSVLDSIAKFEADFVDPSRQEGQRSAGRPGAAGGTGREGTGAGASAIPRYQRWVIQYDQDQTLQAYARQLDFFGIELGVLRGGQQVTFVSNFARGRPVVKASGVDTERLFFVWKDAARRAADMQLVQKAGIPTGNIVIAQFFSKKLEDELARLERAHANKKPEEIQTTVFGIRRANSGYEFYVRSQATVK